MISFYILLLNVKCTSFFDLDSFGASNTNLFVNNDNINNESPKNYSRKRSHSLLESDSTSSNNEALDLRIHKRDKKDYFEFRLPESSNQAENLSLDKNHTNDSNFGLSYREDYESTFSNLKDVLEKSHILNLFKMLDNVGKKIVKHFNTKAKASKEHLSIKRFRLLDQFLNFNVYLYIKMDKKTIEVNQEEEAFLKIYECFKDYIINFNTHYCNLISRSSDYSEKYTYVKKAFINGAYLKRQSILIYNHLFTEYTKILKMMIPEMTSYEQVFERFPFSAILMRTIHSISSLLVSKLYLDNEKLFEILNDIKKLSPFKIDVLRYRTIFLLIPMNDPILINYSFESFALCFYSFIDFLSSTEMSREYIRFTTPLLWANFQIFSLENKKTLLNKHRKFLNDKYISALKRKGRYFKEDLDAFDYGIELDTNIVEKIITYYENFNGEANGIISFKENIELARKNLRQGSLNE
ncbi:hypothetical protein TUBRATIS_24410 [Tubulinosema ratisbonensis]|uniref:Uncharacterized protein n=1 Tax=Tubulinosema ratisbonensis TaxID=291195 RepID=A0A437AJ50_9MICR|nr:hypothetical protein TUBRATIS_24410 [Tubulinosema ratisbonensis]